MIQYKYMKTTAVRDPRRTHALEALRVNTIVARAQARLSQGDLAKRSGVSRPTISRIERGAADVGVDAVQRIADALGLTVADLFAFDRPRRVDGDELVRRHLEPDAMFVDAEALFAAIDEAEQPLERYSRSGRPRVAR